MFGSINGIILAIFTLGFLIFIHELGHFLAARRCGIRVDKFSIGFGPKLIGFKRGDTDYCISLIPFGGFVKMPGENPEERTGAPDEFPSAPVGHRIFVAIAGPAMNVAFGIIVFSLIYLFSGEYVRKSLETTQIGHIVDGSPAQAARLQPGDKLISINGKRLKDWRDLRMVVAINPDEELDIEIIRNGQEQTLYNVKTDTKEVKARKIGQLGVSPKQEVLISHVDADSWAEKSGLKTGDLIDKVNNKTIYTYTDLDEIARQKHGTTAQIEIQRGFIFEIEGIRQEDLNKGLIPLQLRNMFKKHNVALSRDASISTLEDGEGWTITDLEEVYNLQEGEREINVFNDNGGSFVKNLHVDWRLVVGAIQKDSYIESEGIRVGDRLISIDGVPVHNFVFDQKVQELAKIHAEQPVKFEFHRDLLLRAELENDLTDSDNLEHLSEYVRQQAEARQVRLPPNFSLDKKSEGAFLLKTNKGELFAEVKIADGKLSLHPPISETYTAMLKLRPPHDNENLLTKELRMDAAISGLALSEPVRITEYNFVTAWERGVKESWSMVAQAVSMVGHLVTGEVAPELLSGPVGIVTATAETARFGFRELIYFAGFISVNLAFVNLLPIPIADGGLILFFIIEKLRGKPLSIRKQMIIQQVSIVLIVGLFLYITWFDFVGIFK